MGVSAPECRGRKRQNLTFAASKIHMFCAFCRKETVADSLLKCVKKGKTEEQSLAAQCISLLALQLGPDLVHLYTEIQAVLSTMLADNTASVQTRAEVRGRASLGFVHTWEPRQISPDFVNLIVQESTSPVSGEKMTNKFFDFFSSQAHPKGDLVFGTIAKLGSQAYLCDEEKHGFCAVLVDTQHCCNFS